MAPADALLLGLDVGTTATKAVLVDPAGHTVATATASYGLITPQPGWVEQDPEALWQAVITTIRQVVADTSDPARIVALSLASQGGTTIPVDAAGTPVHNAISWMDERGDQAGLIEHLFGSGTVYATTGWMLGKTLPLQHLAWLRDERHDVIGRTARVRFVNDFIVQRLTGTAVMNPSDATMTQLFNISTGDWEERFLKFVRLSRDQVSPVQPSGTVVGPLTAEASRITGLLSATLVVNGAHDQYCAAVGTGVTEPGAVLLSCGTAWVLLAVPVDLESGFRSGMSISCHAVPGRWGAIRSLGGVGASLEWLVDQVWHDFDGRPRAEAYAALNAAVAGVPAGAHDLLFYPLAGGHSPIGSGRGGFLNLALQHTRADMARAVMEGICFELRWTLDEITASGLPVETLTMVGGAAESAIWPQIVADTTGLPVILPAASQAAARGAAILAGVGAGLFADAESAYRAFRGATSTRVPDAQRPYDAPFARYQDLCRTVVKRRLDPNQGGI